MRLAVLGTNGMVGFELNRSLLALGDVVGLDRAAIDLADLVGLRETMRRLAPDVIVNAAAYTNVDQAESDRDTAQRINGDAVRVLAEVAANEGALIIHYSTDYVFDGKKDGAWKEDDSTAPVNAYGHSKLLGEIALADSGADWLCIRTSWVYGSRGRNFIRTILKLAEEREELRVIDDQVGAPTAARNLADATAHVVARAQMERSDGRFASALLHYAAAGRTTWYGVATEALAIAREVQTSPTYRVERIVPIATGDFPTAARRPSNSLLATDRIQERFGVVPPDWRVALRRCIEELR